MANIWKVLSLERDDLELKVLPGIGGRLWDVVIGGSSLLFQNPDLVRKPVDLCALKDLPTRSPQFKFPLWGGEKTWIAPDRDWRDGAPYPVLDSAPYRVAFKTDEKVELQSDVCPISRLNVKRMISLENAGVFSIEHTVTNCGSDDRISGIWSVMMLTHPSKILVEDSQTGPVSPVFGDHAPFVRETDSRLVIDCAVRGEFKLGVHVPSGKVVLRRGLPNGMAHLDCQTSKTGTSDEYAHGHSFEVFNSGDYPYCEAEWHGPARRLSPGEEMSFTQRFRVSATVSR